MKGTGIVRRIDDLGRIVIPKEIRRTLGLREGDPMEVCVEDDAVIFRKYDAFTPTITVLKRTKLRIDDDWDLDCEEKHKIMQKLQEAIELLERKDDDG